MDPGQQLLDMINGRVARGEDRHAAQAAVFRANPGLVHDWHHAGEPSEHEMTTYPGDVLLTTHDDPGQAMLALVEGYVGLGMDRSAAVSRAMREHPLVTAAYDAGRLIPKAPVRPTSGSLRRVRADQMVPGRPYLHLCSDEASGGGIFAVGH